MKAAMLVYRPSPYHLARLGALQRTMPAAGLAVVRAAGDYVWRDAPGSDGPRVCFDSPPGATAECRAVTGWLDARSPDAVLILGYSMAWTRAALGWCLAARRPAVLMSDSTGEGAARSGSRAALKRLLVGGYGAFLVAGTPQARYLTGLGAPAERIFTGFDAVDNDAFAMGADAVRREAARHRRALGLPERYVLVVARFLEKKNLPFFVGAFARFRRLTGDTRTKAVMVGYGPEEPALYAAIARHRLDGEVLLRGPLANAQLSPYYALAEALVLPSRRDETWGLVVNEGMATGLPVLVSTACGCAEDLVRPGVNGFLFAPDDAAALAGRLAAITADRERARRMGAAGRAIIAEWGLDGFARGAQDALACAVVNPPERGRMLSALLAAEARLRRPAPRRSVGGAGSRPVAGGDPAADRGADGWPAAAGAASDAVLDANAGLDGGGLEDAGASSGGHCPRVEAGRMRAGVR